MERRSVGIAQPESSAVAVDVTRPVREERPAQDKGKGKGRSKKRANKKGKGKGKEKS